MFLMREIPIIQGTFPFTQLVFPQSTGGQQETKSHNLADPPGKSQVQSPVKSQLSSQLYKSQSSLEKYLLAHQGYESLSPQLEPRGWINMTAHILI